MGEEEKTAPAGEEKVAVESKLEEGEEKGGNKPAAVEEEKKKEEEPKGDEKENKEEPPPPPPPPREIILKVYMHCEGCARKVRRSLKGFEGVEDVTTDCKTSKVVVKGDKAEPLKVLERVQKKSHRQVELISPIPVPEEEKKPVPVEEPPKPEEEKEEEPPVITVILRVHMHCEACAMEIKKRILRMKGVESVDPDLKTSEVTVKGAFDPSKLVEYIHKRTGKQAIVVKQDPENKQEEKENESPEKKVEEEEKPKKEEGGGENSAKKEAEEVGKPESSGESSENKGADEVAGEETTVVELKKMEYYYQPPMEFYYSPYPPQIFSDENPNACAVM